MPNKYSYKTELVVIKLVALHQASTLYLRLCLIGLRGGGYSDYDLIWHGKGWGVMTSNDKGWFARPKSKGIILLMNNPLKDFHQPGQGWGKRETRSKQEIGFIR